MGKTRCESCSKSCKGQVVKLQEKHYHTKCFKCKECKKELSPSAFYVRDSNLYCVDDYQKKFGIRCKACNKVVEGEVITALGFTYHISCLSCSKCRKAFDAGQNVTFVGDKHLCMHCATDVTTTKIDKVDHSILVPASPIKAPSSPVNPLSESKVPESPQQSVVGQPNYFSTPAKADESIRANGHSDKSPVVSVSDRVDESIVKNVSSQQNESVPTSNSGVLSDDFTNKLVEDKPLRRGELRFGQHIGQTSYLYKGGGFKKGPSQNYNPGRPEHFHRPMPSNGQGGSFSYKNIRDDIAVSLGSKYDKLDSKEAVDAARYPDAYRKERELPVEREDWPGPPLPAAAYPEIFRHRTAVKTSRHSKDGVDVVDGEDEEGRVDPKTQREIDTLSKIRESGAAQSVLIEITRQRAQGPMLDPRSASRTPNADHEPSSKTRYESPMFASPSRVLDSSARSHSQNDVLGDSRYHSLPPPSRESSLKPGYELGRKDGGVHSREDVNGHVINGNTVHDENELYDPVTGLKRGPRITLKSSSGVPSYLAYKGSMPDVLKSSEEPPKVYPYEQLKLTNAQLPADVDRNTLERHLAKDEFEGLFEMSQFDFYQLPEWKQNDMKRRVELY